MSCYICMHLIYKHEIPEKSAKLIPMCSQDECRNFTKIKENELQVRPDWCPVNNWMNSDEYKNLVRFAKEFN